MASSDKKVHTMAVYNIQERNGEKYFNRLGVAFENKDGSFNVVLHALPVDGKLHIREFRDREDADAHEASEG